MIALTLAAPIFGSTNLLWAKALLLVGVGMAWWLQPPKVILPKWINALFALVAVLGFAALLPATWFPSPPWRSELAQLDVALPSPFSPQPWLTFEKATLLAGGLAWAWLLFNRTWYLRRRDVLGFYAAGALLIILFSFAAYSSGGARIRADGTPVFGIFPNVNQMGNFTALAGILMLALLVDDFMHHRPTWIAWTAGVICAAAGVFLAGSRAGLLVLGVGAVIWFFWMSRLTRGGTWLAASVSVILLLSAMLLVFGSRLAERFRSAAKIHAEERFDFRLLIQRDALPLVSAASWHGIGFGNFEPVFARYRRASENPGRAIHPESDWTWVAIEGGWLIPIAMLAATAGVLRRAWPFASRSDRALRSAAATCVILFALHGLVDVSGHRVGTLWPALLLLAMAVNTEWSSARNAPAPLAFVPLSVTTAGIVLWLGAARVIPLPNSASLHHLKEQIQSALRREQYSEALPLAERALRIAPLDWELYFARGTARALTLVATARAASDFAVARHLEPNPLVAFEEGRVWLSRDSGELVEKKFFLGREPERAAAAWEVLVNRFPSRAPEFFGRMLELAQGYPEVLPYLRRIADRDLRLLVPYLFAVSGPELDAALRELLAADPELKRLSGSQLADVLIHWARNGDAPALEELFRQHPSWLNAGWPALGEVLARRGDFEGASRLAREHVPPAKVPPLPFQKTVAEARSDYLSRPQDLATAIVYVSTLFKSGQRAEALRALDSVRNLPGVPSYLLELEADLAYDARDFERAWRAWRRSAAH